MKKEEKEQNLKALALTSDYKQTFDSPNGRVVLRHLMRRAGFMTTTFVSGDPYTSAFNEGQRAIIIEILKKMKTDIKQLEKELLEEPKGVSDVSI